MCILWNIFRIKTRLIVQLYLTVEVRIKCLYRRHWSSSYGSGAYDFGRVRPFPSIHRRDARGTRNTWSIPYDKIIVDSRLSSRRLDLRDRKDIYNDKKSFTFSLLDYLILLRNANISSSRSRSTFFPDSRCYSRLARVVFFETVVYIVAIDVAQSNVLDCELAPAWGKKKHFIINYKK